jgi:glycosyltransferase involved in cell wall biosynthesis
LNDTISDGKARDCEAINFANDHQGSLGHTRRSDIIGNTFCIFSAQFHPSTGGVEQYTLRLGKALVNQGHRVIVATSYNKGFKQVEEFEGLTVYRFPTWQLFGGRFPLLVPGTKTARLTAQLAEERIERVIVQTHLYALSLHGARFARREGLPLIVIEHGSGHVYLGNRLLDALSQRWEHSSVARLKRHAPAFYAVSKRASQWLGHFGIVAQGELYNAIDPHEVQKAQASPVRDFRAEHQIAPDALVASYISRLVPGKGMQRVIDAVRTTATTATTARQGVPLPLFVAGSGELLQDALSQQDERLIVLGGLTHAEVYALLAQSDLFCFPTELPEGGPVVLLEAAASGCFCICSEQGMAGELIQSGRNGVLLPGSGGGSGGGGTSGGTSANNASTSDALQQALLRALQQAAEDKDFRLRAAQLAKEQVLARFTWETTAQKTQEAFERLLSKNPPGAR